LTINIKQRLKALQYIDIKVKSKHQEIISLKSGILRGQQFDNMPKSKNNKNQSEELNVLIIDKSEQLYREIQALYKERDELTRRSGREYRDAIILHRRDDLERGRG